MPPTRERTINAQGRQKSCAECAKGKRKCDLGNPSCGRCRKQRLTCTYPQPPGQGDQFTPTADGSVHESDDTEMAVVSIESEDVAHATLPVGFDLPTLPVVPGTDFTDFDFGAGIESLETIANMLSTPPEDQCQTVLGRADHRDQTQKTFSDSHIAPFARTRVDWSIAQLRLAPKTMIETNGTPWQHPMLYQERMPQSLQDAYAACALYLARNTTNSDFVSRFIKEHAEALAYAPVSSGPTELLARAHALILYQSMLVFGGEISLYSQAELMLPCMHEVAYALFRLADQQEDLTGSIPLYPSGVARASWAAFIFRESLRRTILAIFNFVTMCNLLRGQLTSCDQSLALGNRLTISAQLWNAKSAFDFAVTWNKQKHFIVKGLDFSEVMSNAMPEDIDILGKMIMTGLQGEDDIKGWFYTRGGVL